MSKTKEAKNRTEVRFPVDLKKEMRIFCIKNDITIRECVLEAVKRMIGFNEQQQTKSA